MNTVILDTKATIDGRNANVTIYSDRIVWVQKVSANWKNLLFSGAKTSDVLLSGKTGESTGIVPLESISDVTSTKDLAFTTIQLHTTGGTALTFSVANKLADNVKQTLSTVVRARSL
jgi:hypothetical protein